MAGEQLLNELTPARLAVVLLLLSNTGNASDKLPDVEFLEWLGQVTEVEDLGMNINEMLEEREATQGEGSQENNE